MLESDRPSSQFCTYALRPLVPNGFPCGGCQISYSLMPACCPESCPDFPKTDEHSLETIPKVRMSAGTCSAWISIALKNPCWSWSYLPASFWDDCRQEKHRVMAQK